MSNTDLAGAKLAGAELGALVTGGITGTPASLPTGWAVVDGYLMGPGNGVTNTDLSGVVFPAVDLTGASLSGSNLTGATLTMLTSLENADLNYTTLTGANLNGDDFLGASLGAVTWSDTTCPDGSNSDTNGSSPDSCLGYGI
jgi:uncharacterized protein YjbI with pentapeptide repeats